MAFGFGYGLSYTDFTFEFEGEPGFDISVDPETGAQPKLEPVFRLE